jgi:Sulfotransferase family
MLACPPETGIPALCAQLALVWSMVEGVPLSPTAGVAPSMVPAAAIDAVHATMNAIIEAHLTRHNKRIFCDKTLGAARFGELLHRVYPNARFICLYRHPMDVIMSGIEASPWGFQGYGFETHVAATPDNTVFALARYWAELVSAILDLERLYPERCLRVRYEDLVTSPEEIAREIFAFIGAEDVPGISKRCFTDRHERQGPADYKIWQTSSVTAASIGRGRDIPAALIPPQMMDDMNMLAERLGYRRIDELWGTPDVPTEMRVVDRHGRAIEDTLSVPARSGSSFTELEQVIDERLQRAVLNLREGYAARWAPYKADRFLVVSQPVTGLAGGREMRWQVDLANRTVSIANSTDDDYEWSIVGARDIWQNVICGKVNLNAALRRCEIRVCSPRAEDGLVADARLGVIGEILGLSTWGTHGGS